MAKAKVVKLAKLPFDELQSKAKEIEGYKSMNRFEVTEAISKKDNLPVPNATDNPRPIKPEIKGLKAKLAEATDKKERQELRKAIVQKKRATRKYL